MGLLNEIRLWNWIRQLNLWQYWISATVERDENIKRVKTIEFVIVFNMWDCWMRDECKLDTQLNLWQYWISATVE